VELIVTTFLAIGLTFFGHLAFVIAHHFESQKRRVPLLREAPLTPPPSPKRSPLPCSVASIVPA
jgi:hypothetical protein